MSLFSIKSGHPELIHLTGSLDIKPEEIFIAMNQLVSERTQLLKSEQEMEKYRVGRIIEKMGWENLPLHQGIINFPSGSILNLPLDRGEFEYYQLPIRATTLGQLIREILHFYQSPPNWRIDFPVHQSLKARDLGYSAEVISEIRIPTGKSRLIALGDLIWLEAIQHMGNGKYFLQLGS